MVDNTFLKNSGNTNSRRKFIGKLGAGTLIAGAFSGQAFTPSESQDKVVKKDKSIIWDPYNFGAQGDGKSLDTKAIQTAIDDCHKAGGGTVYLHNGTFLSGTIYLKSHVTLFIDAGTTLLGSSNLDDFPSTPSKFPSFNGEFVTHKMLIYAEDAKNISICGRGTIDGRGDDWIEGPYGNPSFSVRPRIIHFRGCENINIQDVTLYNSGSWVQLYQSCKNIVIDRITVNSRENKDIEKPRFADARGRNNDGLNILDCQFVRISNCFINSGDDAIVIKSNSPDERSGDITVTNCIVSSNASGIKFGTDSAGAFEDINISNCVVYDTRCDAISVLTVDGARVERVNISNITCRNLKGSAIFIRLGSRGTTYRKNAMAKTGILKDVIIENIQGTRISPDYGCSVTGIPGLQVENIILKNINLEFEGGGKLEDIDRPIPEVEKGYPNGKMFGVLPAYGFFIRHAKNVILDEINLRYIKEDFRPAVVCEDVKMLQIRNLQAQCTSRTPALISLRNIHESVISNCRPKNAITVFLKLTGNDSSDIALVSNQLKNAEQSVLVENDSMKPEIKEYGTIK